MNKQISSVKAEKKPNKFKSHLLIFSALLFSLCAIIFPFASCAKPSKSPLGMLNSHICAEIKVVCKDFDFKGKIELSPCDSTEKSREFAFTLSSPKSLEGMEIIGSSEGKIQMRLGNIQREFNESSVLSSLNYKEIPRMLTFCENIVQIKSIRGAYEGFDHVENLTVVETESCLFYFDSKSENLLKVSSKSKEISIYILSFEK